MNETEVHRLVNQVSLGNNAAKEVKALEALPRSVEIEAKLPTLRSKVARLAAFAEPLKETKQRLAESRKKLKLMQEAGSGRIAGLEASGQQDEQSAMVPSGVSRGELTEEQEAELAELQPEVAQRKQQNRETKAKYYRGLKAAAGRVVVLEELAG